MAQKTLKIDGTNIAILTLLQQDARMPISQIARKVKLSSASVYERVLKLKKNGLIQKFDVVLDSKALGYAVSAYVFITLKHGEVEVKKVDEALEKMPEIVEITHVTGDIDIIVKLKTESIDKLRDFIKEKMHKLPGLQHFNTQVIFDEYLQRSVPLPKEGTDE